jgi:hypothetical protein
VTPFDRRLALNQSIFREVNERVAEVANGRVADEPLQYEFFCECYDTECTERLELTLGEYESLRTSPTWFVVVPGHGYPRVEQVVRRNDRFEIVEKLDEAGEVAAATDPDD